MLKKIVAGRCEKIKIWAREREVLGRDCTIHDISTALRDTKEITGNLDLAIEYILVDDNRSKDRLHGRYLICLHGGIRFDQGFQHLRRGRKVDVNPISKDVLDGLLSIFLEEKSDLTVRKRIVV